MLGDPNSSCCPTTPKGQAGKGKYTELIQCVSLKIMIMIVSMMMIATKAVVPDLFDINCLQ